MSTCQRVGKKPRTRRVAKVVDDEVWEADILSMDRLSTQNEQDAGGVYRTYAVDDVMGM